MSPLTLYSFCHGQPMLTGESVMSKKTPRNLKTSCFLFYILLKQLLSLFACFPCKTNAISLFGVSVLHLLPLIDLSSHLVQQTHWVQSANTQPLSLQLMMCCINHFPHCSKEKHLKRLLKQERLSLDSHLRVQSITGELTFSSGVSDINRLLLIIRKCAQTGL